MDSQDRPFPRRAPSGARIGGDELIPATRDASGRITLHPEALEVTPVDEELFRRITTGDVLIAGQCARCGYHPALFVCAGRFVGLCPRCTGFRIELLREEGAAEPKWITVLYEEVNDQAARQRRRSERPLTVSWDDVYTCARCGRPIRAEDARYCEPPGENTSPPYCQPCADQLRGGRAP